MRSILVLGLVATLTVAAVESLECPQRVSFPPECDDCDDDYGEDGDVTPSPCPEEAVSCGCSAASWPADGELRSYRESFCSPLPRGTSLDFAVRVTGADPAWFVAETVEEGKTCDPNPLEDPALAPVGTGHTQCPACLALDADSCEETIQTCNARERCVDLLAQIVIDGVAQYKLALKGCSNITRKACKHLHPGNVTLGNVFFQRLVCSRPTLIAPTCSSG